MTSIREKYSSITLVLIASISLYMCAPANAKNGSPESAKKVAEAPIQKALVATRNSTADAVSNASYKSTKNGAASPTHKATQVARNSTKDRATNATTKGARQESGGGQSQKRSISNRPNVLMIIADDLNHWVHHMGRNRQSITPNMDRLAKRGVTFLHAYCAAPVCNPSRAALMSGYRPSSTGVYENITDWRKLIDRSAMITTLFRNNGYTVLGAGKIYHQGLERFDEFDEYCKLNEVKPTKEQRKRAIKTMILDPLNCRDEEMPDYKTTSWAIEQIMKKRTKPFFLACGLKKPHLPWSVPKKYYDMYKGKIDLPKVSTTDLDDIPTYGKQLAYGFPPHDGIEQALTKAGKREDAIRAYLACITFSDMNVGRLLDALDKSGASKDTIVVFFGDHGYHLGEKMHWRKFALWEEATRNPLIWIAPGVTTPGGVCNRTVDLMSVYPTLADLCRLPVPQHVEGVSIMSLLRRPGADWNTPALSTYGFKNHALRSEEWRYIRYHDDTEELYDEKKDPYEWKNLAGEKRFESVKHELAKHFPVTNKEAPAGDAGHCGQE